MPTNNPNYQSSSQASKGAAESKSKLESSIEQGGQRAEKAIERIEKGAEQAASSAIERVREVREQATSGVAQQRDMLATRIHRVGQVLHGSSETLAEEDVWVREALEHISQRAHRLAERRIALGLIGRAQRVLHMQLHRRDRRADLMRRRIDELLFALERGGHPL